MYVKCLQACVKDLMGHSFSSCRSSEQVVSSAGKFTEKNFSVFQVRNLCNSFHLLPKPNQASATASPERTRFPSGKALVGEGGTWY